MLVLLRIFFIYKYNYNYNSVICKAPLYNLSRSANDSVNRNAFKWRLNTLVSIIVPIWDCGDLLGQNGWSRIHQTSFSSYVWRIVRCFRRSQVSATAGNYWLNSVDQVLRCSTCMNQMHQQAEFELDSASHWQPVKLLQRRCHVKTKTGVKHQLDWTYCFEDIAVIRFWHFGWTMPIRVYSGGFGGFYYCAAWNAVAV